MSNGGIDTPVFIQPECGANVWGFMQPPATLPDVAVIHTPTVTQAHEYMPPVHDTPTPVPLGGAWGYLIVAFLALAVVGVLRTKSVA